MFGWMLKKIFPDLPPMLKISNIDLQVGILGTLAAAGEMRSTPLMYAIEAQYRDRYGLSERHELVIGQFFANLNALHEQGYVIRDHQPVKECDKQYIERETETYWSISSKGRDRRIDLLASAVPKQRPTPLGQPANAKAGYRHG